VFLNRKTSKGVKGVFAAKDVERYLEDIMDLERKVKLKDIQISQLQSQLDSVLKELNSSRKQLSKLDSQIQEQRGSIATLNVQVDELQGETSALSVEKDDAMDKLKKHVETAAPIEEHETLKIKADRLERQIAELRHTLERRDDQVKRLTEENLKIKDRLKFLKEEG
jgi:chromosome segregation ATPase